MVSEIGWNWSYFKFTVESSSFLFNNFKTEKFKLAFEGCNRPVCHLFGFTSVFRPKFVAVHPVKRIVTALMSSPLFRFFSLFLPHLRTLAQQKRSELKLSVVWWAESVVSITVAKYNIFTRANNGRSLEKKISDEAICSRYQRALSGF